MFQLKSTKSPFFDRFETLAGILVEVTQHMVVSFRDFDDPARRATESKALEDLADGQVHEVMDLLHSSFITPLERDDIRRLVMSMDNVVDFTEGAMSRMSLYSVGEVRPEAHELAALLVECTTAVRRAVLGLRDLKRADQIREACVAVHGLENKGDALFQRALARLFQPGEDLLTLIKWKEVFETLECAVDSCEDVVETIEGILMEHA